MEFLMMFPFPLMLHPGSRTWSFTVGISPRTGVKFGITGFLRGSTLKKGAVVEWLKKLCLDTGK
jgi:hypothetical protein